MNAKLTIDSGRLVVHSDGFKIDITESIIVQSELEADCIIERPCIIIEKFSSTEKDNIASIVRKELKSQATEDYILKVTKSILVSLMQVLYIRRGFWKNELNTKAQ